MGIFNRKATEEVIDLREREPAPAPSAPQWGSPVPCPVCDGRGFVDHIDPFRELMYLHCTACGEKYERDRSHFAPEAEAEAEVPETFESFTSYIP